MVTKQLNVLYHSALTILSFSYHFNLWTIISTVTRCWNIRCTTLRVYHCTHTTLHTQLYIHTHSTHTHYSTHAITLRTQHFAYTAHVREGLLFIWIIVQRSVLLWIVTRIQRARFLWIIRKWSDNFQSKSYWILHVDN